MKNITFFALLLTLAVLVTQPGQALAATTTPAKISVKATAPAKVSTKTVTKAVVKPVTQLAPKTAVPTVHVSSAAIPVSASAVTSPTAKCLQAVGKANKYCASVASGCSSASVTAKCKAANDKCEQQQKAALELCPAI